jgi:hypothetical protein
VLFLAFTQFLSHFLQHKPKTAILFLVGFTIPLNYILFRSDIAYCLNSALLGNMIFLAKIVFESLSRIAFPRSFELLG